MKIAVVHDLRWVISALKPIPPKGAAWLKGSRERRTGIDRGTAILGAPDVGSCSPLSRASIEYTVTCSGYLPGALDE